MDKRIERLSEIKNRWGMNRKNYLHPKEASWAYIRYRILRPLLKLKYRIYRNNKNETPWLSPASIEFFKEYLDGSQVGLEFGSGASTVFFCSRVKKLVSIEHFKPWYDKVNQLTEKRFSDILDYRFIEKQSPDSDLTFEQVFPNIHKPFDYEYRKDFINYFQAVSDIEDDYFDFVLVDGRARPECVFACINKLKSNGLMVLDNSERERYKIVFEVLSDWQMISTTNGLTDTTFWVKP